MALLAASTVAWKHVDHDPNWIEMSKNKERCKCLDKPGEVGIRECTIEKCDVCSRRRTTCDECRQCGPRDQY